MNIHKLSVTNLKKTCLMLLFITAKPCSFPHNIDFHSCLQFDTDKFLLSVYWFFFFFYIKIKSNVKQPLINLILSSMYRPLFKLVWSNICIYLHSFCFRPKYNNEMGLQFFNKCRSSLYFGKFVMKTILINTELLEKFKKGKSPYQMAKSNG